MITAKTLRNVARKYADGQPDREQADIDKASKIIDAKWPFIMDRLMKRAMEGRYDAQFDEGDFKEVDFHERSLSHWIIREVKERTAKEGYKVDRVRGILLGEWGFVISWKEED